MTGKIRLATEKDAEAILKIYAPYIEKTAITFEYQVPSLSEFSGRISKTLEKYPWIVYEEDGEILGYAYAGPEYSRAAYQWLVGTSIYLSEEAQHFIIDNIEAVIAAEKGSLSPVQEEDDD